MWAQKTRTKWILQGDRNTKFFQTVVKQRRAKNKILQIKDSDGNITDNLMDIESILLGISKIVLVTIISPTFLVLFMIFNPCLSLLSLISIEAF